MGIHSPELFWENILCLGVLTVGFAESCLVSMWEVARYWCGGDRAIVVWVSWVSQAVVTANGTALGPPETRLSCSSLLPGRSQLTRPVVSTGTACSSFACSILEAINNTVKGVTARRDTTGRSSGLNSFKCKISCIGGSLAAVNLHHGSMCFDMMNSCK